MQIGDICRGIRVPRWGLVDVGGDGGFAVGLVFFRFAILIILLKIKGASMHRQVVIPTQPTDYGIARQGRRHSSRARGTVLTHVEASVLAATVVVVVILALRISLLY